MHFGPRAELLGWDELDRIASAFISLGVRKIRLTGGEPLVRKGIIEFVGDLSRHLKSGALDELTITTNGTSLARNANMLARHGIKRINVSLDSLDPAKFARITRGGRLGDVFAGIDAAIAAGIAVKINTVALRDENLDETVALAEWSHARGAAISFIEVMPLGDVEQDRIAQHVPMTAVRALLERRWTLVPNTLHTGGPARYVTTDEGGTIGFITPLTQNFCGGCNRVRVTATGRLCFCLGHEEGVDLRALMRDPAPAHSLEATIARSIDRKPGGHEFRIGRGKCGGPARHMSVTGG